jgi:hypothetical protein
LIMLRTYLLCMISTMGVMGCSSMERVINFPQYPAELKIEEYKTNRYKAETNIFIPIDTQARLRTEGVSKKIDSLHIIIDERSTRSKILKQNILTELLLSIPTDAVNVQLWSIGHINERYALPDHIKISHKNLFNPKHDFNQELLHVSQNILDDQTPAALIIIKDFQSYSIQEQDTIDLLRLKANSLTREKENHKKQRLISNHENFCVFAVGPNNKFSSSVIDRADWCGFSTTSTEIFHGRNASHFLEKIIYGPPLDSDEDGIPDYIDECSETPRGKIVDQTGCPIKFE